MGEYHSDRPITSEEYDLFNRSSFADNVVKVLSSFDKNESFVIGLYAKWGFGKTSAINLIDKKLSNRKSLCSIRVNAWTLNGDISKIMWEILSGVYTKLQIRDKKLWQRLRHWSRTKLADSIKNYNTSIPVINVSVSDVGNILSHIESIEKIKKEIQDLLIKEKVKVIVFVDDIDRLESKQIVDLFRMMSNIADYNGITYVLPFDKEFVSAAIKEHLPKGQSGADFLEKIIQVPLHLPSIPQAIIDKVFTGKLNGLLNEFSISISKEEIERFQSLYFHHGANNYIQSPRDINKIANVLRFSLPINYKEANIVDVIIIEMIRVFDETLYHKIRKNKEMLIKQSMSAKYMLDEGDKKRQSDFNKIFGQDDSFRLDIIKQLFPATHGTSLSFFTVNDNSTENLRKLQRVASENYFDIFFASFDEQNGISDRKIMALLNNATDKKTIDENLNIINENNFDIALRTIADNIGLISARLDFCKSLLDLAEILPKYRHSSLMLSAFDRILFTIDDILKGSRARLADYTELLTYNYDKGRIDTIPFLIRQVVLYSDKKKIQNSNSREEVVLDENELIKYKEAALRVIRDIAKNNKMPLDTNEDYAFLYSYWADFGTKNEISRYVRKHVKSADAAVDFISQFLGKWSSMGKSDYYRGDLNVPTFAMIGNYVDQKYLYDLVVMDKRYKDYKGIEQKDLISFEHSFDNNVKKLGAVGNEHTNAFRSAVAQQFIFLYENSPVEAEVIDSNPAQTPPTNSLI